MNNFPTLPPSFLYFELIKNLLTNIHVLRVQSTTWTLYISLLQEFQDLEIHLNDIVNIISNVISNSFGYFVWGFRSCTSVVPGQKKKSDGRPSKFNHNATSPPWKFVLLCQSFGIYVIYIVILKEHVLYIWSHMHVHEYVSSLMNILVTWQPDRYGCIIQSTIPFCFKYRRFQFGKIFSCRLS